ncbi:helix-turn-helix domain-containing protein [Saccharopolyspora erythraea]|uniref:helix-turn-helix domain-containing protein n=1 Tax=Saccharopolyspora erythraea TaxID=1836 RepID=UPI001BAD0FAE|nr:helix-turn-helix transcriptional regulator [Saccharopolyspora erythraea]QUH03171.1 helix-turn-helix domain-containing protein [Saccharopolyspora erythraea]
MPGNRHTSVRSRQIANELRRYRETAGLSCSDAGAKLGVSGSKISRIETGASGFQIEDVAALLGLYHVPAAERRAIVELAKKSDEKGWWERQTGLPQNWKNLIEFEAKAKRLQNFENMFIPGLLQTAEYLRAIVEGIDNTLSEVELDTLVAARMARQIVLSRFYAPQFLAVIDETVLRRPVGEKGVMKRQLRHLLTATDAPHITLRIVPISAGAHAGLHGPFLLMDFEDEPDIVYVGNHYTELFLEEDQDLASYRLALRNILNAALAPGASAELIETIATEHDS